MRLFEFFRREAITEDTPERSPLLPRSRSPYGVTPRGATKIGIVFSAMVIHVTAAAQLTIDSKRNGVLIPRPALLRKPSQLLTLPEWLELSVQSLALYGNAFYKVTLSDRGAVLSLDFLDPTEVTVEQKNYLTPPKYHYKGKVYNRTQIKHVRYLMDPSSPIGLSPIGAARAELNGLRSMADYSQEFFTVGELDTPNGILKTEQALTSAEIKAMKKLWRENSDGGVRILGKGLNYQRVPINPKDAQFIESRSWTNTELARIMNVPPSLLNVENTGSAQTYANIEQDWIKYTRFHLMRFLTPIEGMLNEVLPITQTAKFNLEGLLRTDTKTRYEAHEIGLRAGFLTVNEVRSIEDREPIKQTSDTQETETELANTGSAGDGEGS